MGELAAESLTIDVNGQLKVVRNRQTLVVPKDARLVIQGVRTNAAALDSMVEVNFKGFAPPKAVNDGNDLFFPIYTGRDLLSRFSVNGEGRRYPVVASYKERVIGYFWVELN